jgi:hypothetical protein
MKINNCMCDNKDYGLETLLDLNGVIIDQGNGYWVKFDVSKTNVTKERPHGLRYSLTLHDKYGKRLMGYDNAHAVKLPKKYKYSGRIIEYDHYHRHSLDNGIPYEFKDPYQLIQDFFEKVDEVLKKQE